MITNNFQIAGLISRGRRFRYEHYKSSSSSLGDVSEPDFTRSHSYLDAMVSYLDWIVSQPKLDLPESTPKEINLGDPEPLDLPENEAWVDIIRMYDLFEIEVGNSQSSRMGDGLIQHDETRIRAIIDKMKAFLDNYVAAVKPLDLPESVPLRSSTGPGRTGV